MDSVPPLHGPDSDEEDSVQPPDKHAMGDVKCGGNPLTKDKDGLFILAPKPVIDEPAELDSNNNGGTPDLEEFESLPYDKDNAQPPNDCALGNDCCGGNPRICSDDKDNYCAWENIDYGGIGDDDDNADENIDRVNDYTPPPNQRAEESVLGIVDSRGNAHDHSAGRRDDDYQPHLTYNGGTYSNRESSYKHERYQPPPASNVYYDHQAYYNCHPYGNARSYDDYNRFTGQSYYGHTEGGTLDYDSPGYAIEDDSYGGEYSSDGYSEVVILGKPTITRTTKRAPERAWTKLDN